jgi:glyoxylase-like metal-dependent hydrolase (beta-lactamase superfamily II)
MMNHPLPEARMEITVISIGALAKNPLWNERVPVRPSHATTTLVRTHNDAGQEVNLLTDPSLPGEALDARLYERAGIHADAITYVFLTNWRPVHRRGLERFAKATWWMSPTEVQAATDALEQAQEHAQRQSNAEMAALIQKERPLLAKVQPAPDDLADAVQIYPLPGYTPGQCGLIVTEPMLTTLIAGDAVPTRGHFAAGQVFPDCWDLDKAKASLQELMEVADVIIPGHDNLFLTPRAQHL